MTSGNWDYSHGGITGFEEKVGRDSGILEPITANSFDAISFIETTNSWTFSSKKLVITI